MMRFSVILVKGARKFGLERGVNLLQQKIHSTVVDLDAISHNLDFFRSKLAANTQLMVLMVMVKALSYGSSNFEIANFLQHHRIDYLAVTYTDEGIALREHGITLPIIVTNPTPESFEKMLRHSLEPVIYSLRLLQALGTFLAEKKKDVPQYI